MIISQTIQSSSSFVFVVKQHLNLSDGIKGKRWWSLQLLVLVYWYHLHCLVLSSVFFSTIFRQFQANTCRNSELEEKFGWVRQKNCWVRAKFARFLLDFGSVSLFLQGFCLKIPKFWVRWWKSAELASKFAWVRPKNRSELGAQNRKKNTDYEMLLKLLKSRSFNVSECRNSKPFRSSFQQSQTMQWIHNNSVNISAVS